MNAKHMNYSQTLAFFQDKRVLVTGHTGFKGSWLVKWLDMLGAEVFGYALAKPADEDLFDRIHGSQLCESHIDDVLNRNALSKFVSAVAPDVIFHLAAQPLVTVSYELPASTFETNVLGTVNVLDACRQLENQCSVVIVTTDKVYENREWFYPYREGDRLGGHDPYSASKACAELVVNSYRKSFFGSDSPVAVASARAGNVIGGGDMALNRIVPDIVRGIIANEEIVVRSPNAVRPWQHVLDPLFGYIHLAYRLHNQPDKFSEGWNLSPYPHDQLTVLQLAKIAVEHWGKGSIKVEPPQDAVHEAHLLLLDNQKSIQALGWNPHLDSREAVIATVDWYKSVAEGDNPGVAMKKQIQEFMALLCES